MKRGWQLGVGFVVAILGIVSVFSSPLAGEQTQPLRRLREPIIEVWKTRREMVLRDGDVVVRRYKIVLGLEPLFAKRERGDLRTPVGRYFVSDKNPRSRFHKFIGISYPNIDDAEQGYRNRMIDADQWADIYLANARGQLPTWRTPLGGRVGIHGHGGRPVLGVDWTEGCIAVTNEEIDELYDLAPIGTPVIIYP